MGDWGGFPYDGNQSHNLPKVLYLDSDKPDIALCPGSLLSTGSR